MLYRLSKRSLAPRENLGENLTVFRINYVKPQSMATLKDKFQRLVVQSRKPEVN